MRARAYLAGGEPAGARVDRPSHAQSGLEAVLEALASAIQSATEVAEVPPRAVGLAVPGHIDDAAGLVRWAPNFGETVDGVFRYWEDVPLKRALEERCGLPVRMDNDANLAALGEYLYGGGKGHARCLVMFTIGTGIGGGVILGPGATTGRSGGPLMLVGGNKGGAELGHLMVMQGGLDCNSGEYGSLEAYCQKDAIVRRAVHRLRRGRKSLLRELAGGDWARVTPAMISQAAEQGDELALEVWAEIGTALGAGIGSAINVFAPDIVAIGGQIAKAWEFILGPARRAARDCAIPTLFRDCNILQAELLDDAGMLGASALAHGELDGA